MASESASLRILVTDGHELAGLGAVRSLGRAGHNVIAAYPQHLATPPSVRSRYCAGEFRYPDPWEHQGRFRDWLREQAHSSVFDAILPVSEASIVAAAAVRSDFPRNILTFVPPERALTFTLSKYQAARKAIAIGIPCPRTVFVHDGTGDSWNVDLSSLPFPVVLRTDNQLAKDGVYLRGRTVIVRDPSEAANALRALRRTNAAVIAQTYIPGTGAGAFLLRDRGKILLTFAHRRLHEVPYYGGYSSYRESCRDDQLVEMGTALLEAIGYEGVAMVEFRRSAGDGRPYFLEINGRLWGSLALALHAGADFPRLLVECREQRLAPVRLNRERRTVRCRNVFPGDVAHVLSVLKSDGVAWGMPAPSKVGAVARFAALSFNPAIRHDYFWLADPMPGIAQAKNAAVQIGRELLTTVRRQVDRLTDNWQLRRLRAQHDRRGRRTYFSKPLSTVAFVCYGNICRSPFAAHYWNDRLRAFGLPGPLAISKGFHPQVNRQTPARISALARRHHVDLSAHRSCSITKDDVERVDAIFVMDRTDYRNLMSMFPWARDKTFFLAWFAEEQRNEIGDPYMMPEEQASRSFDLIVRSLDGLFRLVTGPTTHIDRDSPRLPVTPLGLAVRPRVLLLGDSLAFGGTEGQFVEVARGLYRRGWKVDVGLCLSAKGDYRDKLVDEGIRVISHDLTSFRSPRFALAVLSLARTLRASRTALVHSFGLYSNILGVLAARLARVPVIASQRDLGNLSPALQTAGLTVALRLATQVLVNSKAVADRLIGSETVSREKIVLIPNGVDVRRFAPRAATAQVTERITIGTVARLRPEKGISDLVHAAHLLAQQHPAARFVIWGDGPCRPALERLVEDLDLQRVVEFRLSTSEPERALHDLDIFVLPSLSEACSNALLEAMATALPVVATNVGGIPSVLDDERTGLLVPSGDPQALALALRRLIAHPSLAASLGGQARVHVKAEFGLDRMIARMESLYDKTLSGSASDVVLSTDHATFDSLPLSHS